MSEARHTPGPWKAERENWRGEPDPHRIYISGDVRECGDEDDEDDPPAMVATSVAIVEGNATSANVTAANAALIVAAPELLEALRAMLGADLYADGEGIWYFEKSDTEDGKAAVEKARAAIARATGAAPERRHPL